jgi:hypothetical protein
MSYAQAMTAAEIIGGGALGVIGLWYAWKSQKLLEKIHKMLAERRGCPLNTADAKSE